MRISEISERSGVSVASIKFYVREGLLPGGERRGYNQTAYSEAHVARIRLIRALIDTGGLTVAAVQKVLAAIDDDDLPMSEVMGIAQCAIPISEQPPTPSALDRVRAVTDERGWVVGDDSPGLALAAQTAEAFAGIGRPDILEVMPEFAEAAEIVARADLRTAGRATDRTELAQTVVLGTVLGDRMLAGLRRMAQEHLARRTASAPTPLLTEDDS